ncbi:MAG: fibrobacter succinogenes major paralogous domain-containing protein [Myxococcales bacterium]|nr:fibrobacter succinogenes major paralogous domain-containing protein [Myxococcales bacterium]
MLRFAIVFSVMATSGCGRTGFDATDNNLGGVDSGADPDASSADAASGPCGAELAIGTQCWLAHNLDVGTQIPGAVAPVANTVVEKTCYDDLASNCVSGGGLYEWDEAMAGSTTERAQGICPGGWHIPSDGDWKVLEQFLGMDVATVELYDFRGVQAPALRVGGSTAFDAPSPGSGPTPVAGSGSRPARSSGPRRRSCPGRTGSADGSRQGSMGSSATGTTRTTRSRFVA